MTNRVIFPQINLVEKSEDEVVLSLTIPADLYYFEGHFPEAPILAGVVQVHWAMLYIQEHFNLNIEQHLSVDALKFQVIIAPEYQVKLTLKKMSETKVSFNYSSEHGAHTSGRVVYS
ncbi:acyl-CoA synthetase [Pseudocolwellia sp. HL-MZ19]|uniref:ApeI family dehydratase n=1 Tax=unclassified Pseudocolwellia TaxID=2848178 RepID=UPI003CF8F97F